MADLFDTTTTTSDEVKQPKGRKPKGQVEQPEQPPVETPTVPAPTAEPTTQREVELKSSGAQTVRAVRFLRTKDGIPAAIFVFSTQGGAVRPGVASETLHDCFLQFGREIVQWVEVDGKPQGVSVDGMKFLLSNLRPGTRFQAWGRWTPEIRKTDSKGIEHLNTMLIVDQIQLLSDGRAIDAVAVRTMCLQVQSESAHIEPAEVEACR